MAGRKRTLDRRAMRSYDEEEERPEGEEEEQDDDEEEEDGEEDAEADAEEEGPADEEPVGDEDEELELVKPKKKPKKVAKPKAPAKSRSRSAKHVRLKIVWAVFDNSNKQIEAFPYSDEAGAHALAAKLANDKKATFFVQKVKKPLEE